MIKQTKKTYGGIMKDASKYQTPGLNYYDATYGRTTATDNSSEFSFTNEKGTLLELEFPVVTILNQVVTYKSKSFKTTLPLENHTYSKFNICGSVTTTKGLALITSTDDGYGCVWLYDDKVKDLTLLYINNLGLTKDMDIVMICNYETDKIEKIYWVDGVHQLRFLNIEHSKANGDREEIYNIPLSMLDAVAPFKISQPRIKETTSGGNHTAGMIQYAYNLYKVNGSQTGISPLTELIPLKKTDTGGDVNELVDTLPIVEISNIDKTFDNIKVYSIKYTSLNEDPKISIVSDSVIPDNGVVTVFDDNTSDRTISLEEFLFLGSDIYIPSDIEVKYNKLFLANYHEKNMNFDVDMRAFQFNSSKSSKIVHNPKSLTEWEKELIITDTYPTDNSEKFDSINMDFDTYKYKSDGKTLGGSGQLCEFTLTHTKRNNINDQYFKDNEIYRLAIIFYNQYGKYSKPIWISDFKAPSGNLKGEFNTLAFNLTEAFYEEVDKIKDVYSKPVGYKVLIAERNERDSSIIASGLITSSMINYKGSARPDFNNEESRIKLTDKEPKMPNFLVRNTNANSNYDDISNTNHYPLRGMKNYGLMSIPDKPTEIVVGGKFGGRTWQYNNLLQLYSPELTFNKGIAIPTNVRLRVKNALLNTFNAVWGRELSVEDGNAVTDVRGYDGLTPSRAKYTEVDNGEINNVFDTGLIEHPGGSDPNRYQRALWYRQYGVRPYNENAGNGAGDGSQLIKFQDIDTKVLVYSTDCKVDFEPIQSDQFSIKLYHSFNTSKNKKITIQIKKLNILTDSQDYIYDFELIADYFVQFPNINTKRIINRVNLEGDFDFVDNTITDIDLSEVKGAGAWSFFYLNIKNKDGSRVKGKVSLELDVVGYDDKGVEIISHHTLNFKDGMFDLAQDIDGNLNTQYIEIAPNLIDYSILGTPEFTAKGQSFKNYSNLGGYRYVNTLTSFKADGRSGWKKPGDFGRRIVSVNANNNHCITFVPEAKTYEDIYRDLGFKFNAAIMYGELIKSKEDIYLGGLYGGNRYEEKLRTRYREIGEYIELDSANPIRTQHIKSPGDIYVQTFKFLRMSKDNDNIDQGTYQMEEIVEYPCETRINLTCRNDESSMEWDTKLFYEYDNYHKYNTVYSQKNSIIIHQAEEYYVKDNEKFGATVIPSRQKSAGELIDSWLNILPNDSLSLDGRYGQIEKLVSFNDEIYAFQNKAIAMLSINPRVQIPTEDGIGIQLGTGETLPIYKYITQSSGTLNKRSIVRSPFGVYYYDDYNQSINVFNGQIAPISETAGLHSHIQKYPLKTLKTSPRFNSGVISGYDTINKDVYITFNFDNYTDTFVYNEKRNMFISRQTHRISEYITHNDKLFSSESSENLYRYNVGERNKFFNKTYNTTITFVINPEVDLDTILNTIQFKSEVYLNGVDQPNNTITHYRAYNEFQDTGLTPIISGRRGNTRRFVRDWNVEIGRNKGTRERIRNPWNFLELHFENNNNLELILHDILVSYTI